MKKIIEIDMFKEYVGKLIFRFIVFLVALGAYHIFPGGTLVAIRCVGGYDGKLLLQMFPQNRRITNGKQKRICKSLCTGTKLQ